MRKQTLREEMEQLWKVLQTVAAATDGDNPDAPGLTTAQVARWTGLPPDEVQSLIERTESDLPFLRFLEGAASGPRRYLLDDETLARTLLLSDPERQALEALLAVRPNLGGNGTFGPAPTMLVKGHGTRFVSRRLLRWVQRLGWAVDHRVRVRLISRSLRSGTRRWYLLEPLGLVASASGWHLAARERGKTRWRLYALDSRVERLRVLKEEPFDWPAGFSLREAMRHSWGTELGPLYEVAVRFLDRRVHARVEFETSHRVERSLTLCEDGALIYRDRVQGLSQFQRWVRSFGSSAVVMEPAVLRREMLRSAYRQLQMYQGDAGE